MPAWFIIGAILTLFAVCIAVVMYMDGAERASFVAWIAVAGLVICGFTGVEKFNPSVPKTTMNEAVAEQFGFQPGSEYPLEIGSLQGGSSGSISGGFFHISGESHPTSAFPFNFTNEKGESYMITIPTAKVTFLRVADESDESLSLVVKDEPTDQVCGMDKYWSGIFPARRHVDCRMPVITRQFGDYIELNVVSVVVKITDDDYRSLMS